MSIEINDGQQAAYEDFLQAQEARPNDLLDFEAIVAPALAHHLKSNPAPAAAASFADHAIYQIPADKADEACVKAYILFLKEKGQLDRRHVFQLLQRCLVRQKEKLVIALADAFGVRLDEIMPRTTISILHLAARNNCVKILEEACKQDISLHTPAKTGSTLLHEAVKHNCKDAVIYLLAHGADVNSVDEDGNTPLFYVHEAAVIEDLIKAGADIHHKNQCGNTYLHHLFYSNKTALKATLQSNLDLSLRDAKGRTVLEAGLMQFQNLSVGDRRKNLACCMELFDYSFKNGLIDQTDFTKTSLASQLIYQISCEKNIAQLKERVSPNTWEFFEALMDEYNFRKILGHANSVSNTAAFEYEGCPISVREDTIMLSTFSHLLMELPLDTGMTEEEVVALARAYDQADKISKKRLMEGVIDEGTLQSIQDGKLVILNSGFTEHVFTIVFYKGYFIVCNRGMRSPTAPILLAYKIDPRKVTMETLTKILLTNDKPSNGKWGNFKRLVYRIFKIAPAIAQKLSPDESGKAVQDDLCRRLQKLGSSNQSVGNCAWAAAKEAMRPALGLMRTDPANPATWDRLDEVPAVCHTVSTAMRLQLLEEYLYRHNDSPYPWRDDHLIQVSLKKLKKHLKKAPVFLDMHPLVADEIL